MKTKLLLPIAITSFFLGVLIGRMFLPQRSMHNNQFFHLEMSEMREEFISEKEQMMGEMMTHSDYRCCLEKPCTYCIEKTPGHGEGASCHCLEDVVNGEHPCGECIGEILEGHGNRFLATYFASAIAEEVGNEYKDTLKLIISDKYGIPVEEQI